MELGCATDGGGVATDIWLFRWQAVGSGHIMARADGKRKHANDLNKQQFVKQ
jgi:hypothetical protein